MKKTITIIGIIVSMVGMMYGSYWFGTSQAKVETMIETVTVEKEVVREVEVVPAGYVDCNMYSNTDEFMDRYIDVESVIGYVGTEYGVQLYFSDGTGYYLECR